MLVHSHDQPKDELHLLGCSCFWGRVHLNCVVRDGHAEAVAPLQARETVGAYGMPQYRNNYATFEIPLVKE